MRLLAYVTRSSVVESVHHGFVCVTDPHGTVHYSTGDTDAQVYIRSTAKPLQALALVESGAITRYHITDQELAVICSSHSGEPYHRSAVNNVLKKIGLGEDDLQCGAAEPYNSDELHCLWRDGKKPTPLWNCCSGNHAGILALCCYHGWPIETYTEADHPAQRLITTTIGRFIEADPSSITIGRDNCGGLSMLLPMKYAAKSYARLANSTGLVEASLLASAEKIAIAMGCHPEMVNGDGEFCTELIAATSGRIIGKVGGEGVYGIAIRDLGLGVCIKIADGNERAVYPVALNVLQELGALTQSELQKLDVWQSRAVKDHRGRAIGEIRACIGEDWLEIGATVQGR